MQNQFSLENIEYFRKNSIEQIGGLENQIKNNELKMESLKTRLVSLGDVKKLLIQLKNSKMFDKKDFILNTINTALNDVFMDQEIKIDLVASNTNQEASKLNIKYDIVLYQKGKEMARNEKLLIKNGGGVMAFISILFKILVGYIYSKNKFYIFDESLSEVSELYMPRMGQFLQKFCNKHDFTIILITHTPIIAEYADLMYKLDGEFENDVPTLKIEKIEGTYPEENYFYTKIENFQSIKKLEFRYKGFTAIIGKNNIGKSASFRAVNSILFNNFDMKEFPRMVGGDSDKVLNSRIEFGKFHTKDDPKNNETKISLYKKGQSIIWEFNNMEFVGKNLAFDKVKEKIESIGFKYLKLKEQYKNFKGNIKEQTERLAITTQQDGYYLIGGKTSDTEKVFDFLFDSREVTLAIIDLNNDISSLENELNTLNLENGTNTNLISRLRVEIKHWDVLYKITLIELIRNTKELLYFNLDYLNHLREDINGIDQVLNLANILWKMNELEDLILVKNSEKDKLDHTIEIIDKVVDASSKIDLLKNLFMTYNELNTKTILKKLNDIQANKASIELVLYVGNRLVIMNKQYEDNRLRYILFDKLLNNSIKRDILEGLIYVYDNLTIKSQAKNFNDSRLEKLNKLVGMLQNKFIIQEHFKQLNENVELQNKIINAINYNNKCISVYDAQIKYLDLNYYVFNLSDIAKKIATKKQQYDLMKTTLERLPAEYGLNPCPSCNTLGYTCVGH